MFWCVGLYIEGKLLFLVISDLIVDILLNMIGWDGEIELKEYIYHCSYIWMYYTIPNLCREYTIGSSYFLIEDFCFFFYIAIDAEDIGIFW